MLRTANVVPKTYDELFRHYYPMVLGMVKKARVHPEAREDVTMVLMEKIMQKDLIAQFDPEYISATGAKSNFSSYLSGFVMAYVRHLADRTRVEADRNRTYMDETVHAQAELVSGSEFKWPDVHGFTHNDDLTDIEYDLMVHTVRVYLNKLPVKGKKNFLALFDHILDQLEETGTVHRAQLAEKMGCSPAHMTAMMKDLGAHVRKAQAC